jgi:hypothetical protein
LAQRAIKGNGALWQKSAEVKRFLLAPPTARHFEKWVAAATGLALEENRDFRHFDPVVARCGRLNPLSDPKPAARIAGYLQAHRPTRHPATSKSGAWHRLAQAIGRPGY